MSFFESQVTDKVQAIIKTAKENAGPFSVGEAEQIYRLSDQIKELCKRAAGEREAEKQRKKEAEELADKACSEENLRHEEVIMSGILRQKVRKKIGWKEIKFQADLRPSALTLTDLSPAPTFRRGRSNIELGSSTAAKMHKDNTPVAILPVTKISTITINSENSFQFTTVYDIVLTLIAEDTGLLIAWHRNIEDQIAFAKDAELKMQVISNITFSSMYKVSKLLGKGQFGDVYLASRITQEKTFAVKVIDRQKILVESNVDLQFLAREMSVMRNLDHPHIVKLVDLFFEDRTIYIVTDLCLGGELQNRVVKLCGYQELEAKICIRNVLSAIDYCHKRRYVHRDLKPENILLTSPDDNTNVKIIDFGFAKAVETNSMQMNTVLGTQLYMAPEVISKTMDGYHNGLSPHKVDIWAIGCIAYFILAGQSPFKKKNVLQCQKAILSGDAKFSEDVWKDVSDLCKDAIQQMLVVQPEGRADAEELLEHAWFKEEDPASTSSASLSKSRVGEQQLQEYKMEIVLDKVLEPLFAYESAIEIASESVIDDGEIGEQSAEEKKMMELKNIEMHKHDLEVFHARDKDKKGMLGLSDLLLVFKDLGINLTDKQAEETIRLADVNNDGSIQVDEFRELLRLARNVAKQKQSVEKVFARLDQNKDGFVTDDDLKEAISESGATFEDQTVDDLAVQLLKLLDLDGDGRVSSKDFFSACNRYF